MFSATFLGHHCWLFEAGASKLLVDPLLLPRWGFTDANELRAYPPRTIDLTKIPALDAVFLTHEHEGHFEIASLNLLSRDIPIYISCRSSYAMQRLLVEMGFSLREVVPGEEVRIGDLCLFPLTADQVNQGKIDEWDTLPYLVFDRFGDGSFFTQVDVPLNDSMWQAAKERVARPGIWAYTNNHNQWDFLYAWSYPDERPLQGFTDAVFRYHQKISDEWAAPAAIVVSGGGFSFGGEQAWLNRDVFPLRNEEVIKVLSLLIPERSLAPLPGERLLMKGGQLAEVLPGAELLSTLPVPEWPPRSFGETSWMEQYTPATGRYDLTPLERGQLEEELDNFAAHLYGSPLFRSLYSMHRDDCQGRESTFALMLLCGEEKEAYVYEYEPQGCGFRAVVCEDPVSKYLAVYECYAADLLALLRAEISQNTLTFARARYWNANPEKFNFDVGRALIEYISPLRHPARFEKLYKKVLAEQPEATYRVPFSGERAV